MGRCHITEGAGPPTSPPMASGDHYVDTLNNEHYLSVGNTSVTDWIQISADTDTDVSVYNCLVGLNVGEFVYISADNTVEAAIANTSSKKYSIGLVTSKPTSTTAIVQTNGRAGGLTGLTAGLPIFLSDTLTGGYTQTPITTSGNWLQILGMATDSATISLEISQPVKRV